jgi:S-adenosylmethionine:tRNA ribosyltransferase-isomerase
VEPRDLEYELPEALIAQAPLPERDASRLLVLMREDGAIEHRTVRELPDLLVPSLFVVNDSRVLRARIVARKPTGGRVELLLLERYSEPGTRESWRALGRGTKTLRPGMALAIAPGFEAVVGAIREGGVVELDLAAEGGVVAALEAHGRVPLPPYIRRQDDAVDVERYQTVFARHEGSVAAPTAGLHFSERLLRSLEAAGHRIAQVTLHVGPGTFVPLRAERFDSHVMHEERWEVPEETARAIAEARATGRPIVAVGTTVCRTLESAVDGDGCVRAGAGRTRLFIRPPYVFRAIDVLLTNFHQPRSTLLALVMAFAGIEPVRRAYRAAIEARYRFLSYGDAMLICSKAHARVSR